MEFRLEALCLVSLSSLLFTYFLVLRVEKTVTTAIVQRKNIIRSISSRVKPDSRLKLTLLHFYRFFFLDIRFKVFNFQINFSMQLIVLEFLFFDRDIDDLWTSDLTSLISVEFEIFDTKLED